MKKKIIIAIALLSVIVLSPVHAQVKVEYPQGFAVDMDLDGLTDEGEKQIFKTDPNKADTDGDGLYDGAEVLSKTNPLDPSSVLAVESVEMDRDASWAWYLTRATALIAFILLYIVMFLALTIRLPFFKKILAPIHALNIHRWLSVQAILLALTHGVSLMFDKIFKFSFVEVFVPFVHPEDGYFVAMGVISFYVMILLIVSSYLKNTIPYKIWRGIHFTNVALYMLVFIHALNAGTDISGGFARNIFIYANVLLGVMFVLNFGYRIWVAIRRKMRKKIA